MNTKTFFRETFACAKASDDTIQAVLDIPAREADRPSARCPGWVRYAAAAAVLAILIGAMVGFQKEDNSPTPFFSVYAYASETDGAVLLTDGAESVISNVVNDDTSINNYFDSTPPSDHEPRFVIHVRLDDLLWRDAPSMTVLCDGKVLDPHAKDIMTGFFASTTSDEKGYSIVGKVDKRTDLQIILTAPDGTLLQKSDLLIVPITTGGYEVWLTDTFVADTYTVDAKSW